MRISDWSSDVCSSDLLGRNQPLYARVLALGGGVGLQFAQKLVTAGANHRDAMLFLSRQSDPFKVADIPGISADEQTELARKLLVDGFMVKIPAGTFSCSVSLSTPTVRQSSTIHTPTE